MSTSPRKPVQPWIPPQQPRGAPVRKVVIRGASPNGVLRAGWIYAGITGMCFGLGPWLPLLWLIGYYLIYAGTVVILALSIIAMARGAAGRGIVLLIGAPVLVASLMGAGVGVASLIDAQRKKQQQKAEPTMQGTTMPPPDATGGEWKPKFPKKL